MEIAAAAILDTQWDRPSDVVDDRIFRDDRLALDGWRHLQERGWIEAGRPTTAFWRRVHGRR